MKITYYGHSCFAVESNAFTVVLDPFAGVKGHKDINLDANMVLCSHEHFDHNYRDGVKLSKGENPFEITALPSFHDECNGAKRGPNTVNVLKSEGRTIVHAGDLGHILDSKTLKTIENCDVLMVPVGGCYTIDAHVAIELINLINPKIVIPMHYKDGVYGFDELSGIDEFLTLADSKLKDKLALVKAYGQSLEI